MSRSVAARPGARSLSSADYPTGLVHRWMARMLAGEATRGQAGVGVGTRRSAAPLARSESRPPSSPATCSPPRAAPDPHLRFGFSRSSRWSSASRPQPWLRCVRSLLRQKVPGLDWRQITVPKPASASLTVGLQLASGPSSAASMRSVRVSSLVGLARRSLKEQQHREAVVHGIERMLRNRPVLRRGRTVLRCCHTPTGGVVSGQQVVSTPAP